MKKIILQGLKAIRSALDKAEASLDRDVKNFEPQAEPQTQTQQVEPAPEKKQFALELFPSDNPPPQRPSTYKDRVPLNRMLDEWSETSGVDLKELKARLRAHAGVRRIDYMSYPQVVEAIEWIKGEIKDGAKR